MEEGKKKKQKTNKSNRVRTTDAFSGELPAYLSLNGLLNGKRSYSGCYFVQFWPISQKFNSCDQRTDQRTDIPSYARAHQKMCVYVIFSAGAA